VIIYSKWALRKDPSGYLLTSSILPILPAFAAKHGEAAKPYTYQNQADMINRRPDLKHLIKNFFRNNFPGFFQTLKKWKKKFKKKPGYHTAFKPYEVRALHPRQPERKRVLHFIANFWTGGSARLVIDLVEHLGHLYEQEVITKDVPKVAGYTGVPITLCFEKEGIEGILKELQRFRPHFLHVHYLGHQRDRWGEEDWRWYKLVFAAAEEYGCKIVENINIPTDPFTSKMVSHYVYVSDYVLEKHASPGQNNLVVYPGSDFKYFKKQNLDRLPGNCIGMVYRLERDKINEASIEVFINVVKRRKGTKALIIGGGSLLNHYKKAVADAGLTRYFEFTGYVSYQELPRYYRKMGVFVAPVHKESFGQVTPFAMHMGIPVAAYKVGALPEIIADERMLAPAGDVGALADVIINLLDDPEQRRQIGKANHKRAADLFSVESMIAAYENIYAEISP
jgi:glycosyltransferase involved in cell wall biosynthesis